MCVARVTETPRNLWHSKLERGLRVQQHILTSASMRSRVAHIFVRKSAHTLYTGTNIIFYAFAQKCVRRAHTFVLLRWHQICHKKTDTSKYMRTRHVQCRQTLTCFFITFLKNTITYTYVVGTHYIRTCPNARATLGFCLYNLCLKLYVQVAGFSLARRRILPYIQHTHHTAHQTHTLRHAFNSSLAHAWRVCAPPRQATSRFVNHGRARANSRFLAPKQTMPHQHHRHARAARPQTRAAKKNMANKYREPYEHTHIACIWYWRVNTAFV